MNEAIVSALASETVLFANSIATVTQNLLVVRDGGRGAQSIIGIERVTGMRKLRTTQPALLVISCGLFTIAAASYVSKQGVTVAVAIAVVGLLLVLGYIGTRRAAVVFLLGSDRIESGWGTFRDATSVIRAVNKTRGEELQVE